MSYFVWNIDPVLIDFGVLKIRWYGLMFATAFMSGFALMQWIYQREGKNVEDLDSLLWYMAVGTIVGARLGHCLFYEPAYYLSHPWKILAIWEGGLASHGANIGILISLYVYHLKKGDDYLWLLDRMSIPAALAASLVRIGNFFNSEILGTPTDMPWAIIFSRIDYIPRHPVQLYESLCYLLTFMVLLLIYKKTADKPIRGLLFGILTTIIFVARFFLEFVKTRQASYNHDLWLSTGQILSLPFIAAGVFMVFWALKNYRKQADLSIKH